MHLKLPTPGLSSLVGGGGGLCLETPIPGIVEKHEPDLGVAGAVEEAEGAEILPGDTLALIHGTLQGALWQRHPLK